MKLLSKPRSLVERLGAVPYASLECTQAQVLTMLEEAPIPNMSWQGNHEAFLRQFWEMAREYGPRLPRCSDDIPVYQPELERCNMAVDVALPSQAVTGPAKLLVPWVNHHGLFAVRELRELDATQRALQTSDGRQLPSCFLDFGLQPAMVLTT